MSEIHPTSRRIEARLLTSIRLGCVACPNACELSSNAPGALWLFGIINGEDPVRIVQYMEIDSELKELGWGVGDAYQTDGESCGFADECATVIPLNVRALEEREGQLSNKSIATVLIYTHQFPPNIPQ